GCEGRLLRAEMRRRSDRLVGTDRGRSDTRRAYADRLSVLGPSLYPPCEKGGPLLMPLTEVVDVVTMLGDVGPEKWSPRPAHVEPVDRGSVGRDRVAVTVTVTVTVTVGLHRPKSDPEPE